MSTSAASAPSRRGLHILMGLLAVGVLAYAPKAIEESRQGDLPRYYHGGCVAARGGDIYGPTAPGLEFKYLPIVAQIFSGLASFSERVSGDQAASLLVPTAAGLTVGAGLWYAVLSVSFLLSLFMAVDLCAPEESRHALWLALAGVILCARFFVMNVRLGQMNMFVMLWAVLGCWLIVRRQQHVLGGVAIAFAMALKLVPGGLLLWLAWRRNWRAAIAFLVAGVVFVFVVPMLTWGMAGGVKKTVAWIERRQAHVTDLPRDQAAGQSLSSMANRLFSRTNAVSTRRGAPLYINVVDNRTLAKVMAVVLILLVCMAALGSCRGALQTPRLRAGLEVACMFVLLLLISPESRRAHFITLLLPAAALVGYGLTYGGWRWLALVLGGAFACLCLTSAGLWGHSEAYYVMNAYGIVLLGTFLLFGAVLRALRSLPHGDDDKDLPAPDA